LDIEKITGTRNFIYDATIGRTTDTINSLPWGKEGYVTLSKSSEYFGKRVTVTKESLTPRATWSLISSDGMELGWIDVTVLTDKSEAILSTENTNYMGKVSIGGHTIDTRPYGTIDAKNVATTWDYIEDSVKITQEIKTPRALFGYINNVGWVDLKALTPESILSSKNVNYKAFIAKKRDSINTLPWGVEGFETVTRIQLIVNAIWQEPFVKCSCIVPFTMPT